MVLCGYVIKHLSCEPSTHIIRDCFSGIEQSCDCPSASEATWKDISFKVVSLALGQSHNTNNLFKKNHIWIWWAPYCPHEPCYQGWLVLTGLFHGEWGYLWLHELQVRGQWGTRLYALHGIKKRWQVNNKIVAFFTRIKPLHAKFFKGNKNMYLHFMSFLHIDTTQVVEIIPREWQELTYST